MKIKISTHLFPLDDLIDTWSFYRGITIGIDLHDPNQKNRIQYILASKISNELRFEICKDPENEKELKKLENQIKNIIQNQKKEIIKVAEKTVDGMDKIVDKEIKKDVN